MKKFRILTVLLAIIIIVNPSTAQSFSEQVEKNNQFCFDLYHDISAKNENLFLSPFSVASALAMMYEGAKGKTRQEMSKALHFPDNNEQMNQSFEDIIARAQHSKDEKKYTFNIVNSLWAQKGFGFLNSYFETIKKYYDAPVESVNFKDSEEREDARLKINAWVLKKTNEKIKELLDKGALDNETRLVLVNAVYFIAGWHTPFNKKQTKSGVFYTSDGSVKKEFMHISSRMRYANTGKVKLLEIPYKNQRASMIVLLPNKVSGFSCTKKRLNNKYLENLLKKAEYRNVSLSFPKFRIEYKNDLAEILSGIGMKTAFSDSADFSGMVSEKNIKIDKVIHQTFVDVDESGTEAAAATAVVAMRISSINPDDEVVFNANKPFVFLIKEQSTGSILFLGQLVK